MARHLDSRVKELDNQILSLKNEGLTYKVIATQLNLTDSRCRLAGRRTSVRIYLRNYLRKYRATHPDFYERLKRKVKENYRKRMRTDLHFRLKKNKQSNIYRTSMFGKKKIQVYSDILKAFKHQDEIVSTKILVERLGKPSYYHFYSKLKTAIKKGVIKRFSWGRYHIVTNKNKKLNH